MRSPCECIQQTLDELCDNTGRFTVQIKCRTTPADAMIATALSRVA